MNKPTGQMGRRAFLIELLFAMVAMGLCAAICLAGFVHADSLSRLSYAKTQAVMRVQTAAEQFKVNPTTLGETVGVQSLAYYDKDWNPVQAVVKDGYYLNADCAQVEGMYTTLLTIWSEDGMALYSVEVKKYLPEQTKEVGA